MLVADDSPVNREVMIETLSRFGIVPDLVEDGREAVEAAAKARYDLVFMDGSMPEMDGFEATRAIRAAEAASGTPRVPVVALTAHVLGSAAEAWRDAGMDGVVHKPFTIGDIAACLARHAAGRETGEAEVAPAPQEQPAAAAAATGPQPAQPEAEEELPVLDPEMQAQLKQMAASGRSDFVARVFGLYLEHMPGNARKLEDAAAAGDLEAIGAAGHAMKSMSYNIGASRVAAAAAAIEHAARLDGTTPEPALYATLSEALDATLRAVRAELGGAPADEAPAAAAPVAAAPPSDPAQETLEQALSRAVERDELTVLYQPLVERTTHRTAGAEALLRWTRADGEQVSPARFIPLAEKTGAIVGIGEHVLRRACSEAARSASTWRSTSRRCSSSSRASRRRSSGRWPTAGSTRSASFSRSPRWR